MVRENLDNIPQHPLPDGYRLRPYHPGDRDTWVRLWDMANTRETMTGAVFDMQFGYNLPAMPKRCSFLVAPDGEDIGTATAWYTRGLRGLRWGIPHWVAIVPAYQGRGLSRPLTTATLKRLRQLGHRRAILRTHPTRFLAIRTYLNFGFVPEMSRPDATQAWSLVREHISHPTLNHLA